MREEIKTGHRIPTVPSFREMLSSSSRSSTAGTSAAGTSSAGTSSAGCRLSSTGSQSSMITPQSSLPGTSSSAPLDLTQTPTSSPHSSADSPAPAFQFEYEKADPFENLKKLSELFPHMTTDQLAVECIMEGPTFESLCDIAGSLLEVPLSESPRIRVDKNDEGDDLVGAALAFYKDSKFARNAPVRISIGHQPAIDTGGLRRQVLSEVFENIAMSSTIAIFDGPQDRLRPAFEASSLSSGMLTTMGTMIGHSILMDKHGFPYFVEYCYYYMAGCMDKALTCITTDDVSDSVKVLISEVRVPVCVFPIRTYNMHVICRFLHVAYSCFYWAGFCRLVGGGGVSMHLRCSYGYGRCTHGEHACAIPVLLLLHAL